MFKLVIVYALASGLSFTATFGGVQSVSDCLLIAARMAGLESIGEDKTSVVSVDCMREGTP